MTTNKEISKDHFEEDTLSQDSLDELFHDTGIKPFFYKEIDSTNNEAKRKLRDGLEPPFLVVGETQSGGRGRMGRSFFSPKGGLYFTLALSSSMARDIDLITASSALGVLRAIERTTGLLTKIKWVNDLYLNGKKVVGILTEGQAGSNRGALESFIIGVGINVAIKSEEFSEELRDIATSLYPDGNSRVSRGEILRECVKEIIGVLDEDFIEEYKRECFIIGKSVYRLKDGVYKRVKCLDIDDKAHLIVQYDDGKTESLVSGEVKLVLDGDEESLC